MRIEVIPGAAIDAALRATWQELQAAAGDHLSSPFFSPAWVECVAAVRDDVRVAIVEERGEILGILPFQGTGLSVRPVGGPLCDFQGLIGRLPEGACLGDVLACADIGGFAYDHWLLDKDVLESRGAEVVGSPYIDLRDGLDAYFEARRRAGSKQIRQIQRKLRKLERELGELRFEWHVDDPSVLERLFEWKAAYYARQRTTDRFAHDWIRSVLGHVLDCSEPGFGGLLSGLWAGDRLVAVHLGLRSESVFHYWFPTYDDDESLSRYSPGLGLLLELASRCCDEGIERLDLGRGDERYKSSLASGSLPIAEGRITARSPRGRLLAGCSGLREHVRHWPGVSGLARATRGFREAARFK